MSNKSIIHIIRFVLLILLQGLIISKMNFGLYVHPFIYPLFILLLPFEVSGTFLLFSAFAIGFSVDLFVGTPGLHAAASVFSAFLRPFILRQLEGVKSYEDIYSPSLNALGYSWFIRYILFFLVSHNTFYFFLEAFTFKHFWSTILTIVFSSITSILLILFLNMIFKNND